MKLNSTSNTKHVIKQNNYMGTYVNSPLQSNLYDSYKLHNTNKDNMIKTVKIVGS